MVRIMRKIFMALGSGGCEPGHTKHKPHGKGQQSESARFKFPVEQGQFAFSTTRLREKILPICIHMRGIVSLCNKKPYKQRQKAAS